MRNTIIFVLFFLFTIFINDFCNKKYEKVTKETNNEFEKNIEKTIKLKKIKVLDDNLFEFYCFNGDIYKVKFKKLILKNSKEKLISKLNSFEHAEFSIINKEKDLFIIDLFVYDKDNKINIFNWLEESNLVLNNGS